MGHRLIPGGAMRALRLRRERAASAEGRDAGWVPPGPGDGRREGGAGAVAAASCRLPRGSSGRPRTELRGQTQDNRPRSLA